MVDKLLKKIKAFSSDQYSNENRLKARMQLYRFALNKESWRSWLFRKLDFHETTKILEIGCGNGVLWEENIKKIPQNVHITLTDLSAGMVNTCREKFGGDPRFEFMVLDAGKLFPFRDQSMDMVLASHMLYHVKNKARAFSEISRVLTPGGRGYATTASTRTLQELDAAASGYNPQLTTGMGAFVESFSLENGARQLKKYFKIVGKAVYKNTVIVPDTEPLIVYLASCYNSRQLDILLNNKGEFRRYLVGLMSAEGTFKTTSIAGLFKFGN